MVKILFTSIIQSSNCTFHHYFFWNDDVHFTLTYHVSNKKVPENDRYFFSRKRVQHVRQHQKLQTFRTAAALFLQ